MGNILDEAKDVFFRGIMKFPHPGMLHKADLFKQFGQFDQNLKIVGDYEFMIRVLLQESSKVPIYVPDLNVFGCREGGISHDFKNRFKAVKEAKLILKKHGLNAFNSQFIILYLKTFSLYVLNILVGGRILNGLKHKLK